MDLKYYFDFEKCWDEIVSGYKEYDVFDDNILEDIEDKRISNFMKNQLPVNTDECEISGNHVIFCFSEEYQTANESDNQNDSIAIYIEYDCGGENFTNYSQEQG